MRKESDTSRARDFILENKDKMTYREIVNHIMVMTKLKKTSIQTLVTKILNNNYDKHEIPNGKHAMKAREYIRNNFYKDTREEIIDYIVENTALQEYSAGRIYDEVVQEKKAKPKAEKVESNLYKGRERRFFYFDVSNLWRNA